MKKGYVYTLEVTVAITIVLVSLAMFLSSAQVPESSSAGIIKQQGYRALEYLDQTGDLRALAKNDDSEGIESMVSGIIPSGISVDVDVCTLHCTGTVPNGRDVVAIDYYVSGYQSTFFNKKVRLWMWGDF